MGLLKVCIVNSITFSYLCNYVISSSPHGTQACGGIEKPFCRNKSKQMNVDIHGERVQKESSNVALVF